MTSPLFPHMPLLEHCNDRRLSARGAQDASLKLYLCVMLRNNPRVADAVISNVAGDRFFSVYLPDYGLDLKCVN